MATSHTTSAHLPLAATRPTTIRPFTRTPPQPRRILSPALLRAEPEGKVVREYREDDGTVSGPDSKPSSQNYIYSDEALEPPRKDVMSDAMKKRLREEYIGFGGSPNKPMGSNYFLWIILFVSFLSVASWLTGAI